MIGTASSFACDIRKTSKFATDFHLTGSCIQGAESSHSRSNSGARTTRGVVDDVSAEMVDDHHEAGVCVTPGRVRGERFNCRLYTVFSQQLVLLVRIRQILSVDQRPAVDEDKSPDWNSFSKCPLKHYLRYDGPVGVAGEESRSRLKFHESPAPCDQSPKCPECILWLSFALGLAVPASSLCLLNTCRVRGGASIESQICQDSSTSSRTALPPFWLDKDFGNLQAEAGQRLPTFQRLISSQ